MGAVGFDSKGTFTRFVGWIKSTFSEVGHKHDGGDITSGAVPVSNGGTGATTPTDALVNLGALGARATSGRAYGPLVSVTGGGRFWYDFERGVPHAVTSRNILDGLATASSNGLTATVLDDGRIHVTGTSTADTPAMIVLDKKPLDIALGVEYVLTYESTENMGRVLLLGTNEDGEYEEVVEKRSGDDAGVVFTPSKAYSRYTLSVLGKRDSPGVTYDEVVSVRIESRLWKPHSSPYVPHGYIGLDVTADGTTTTTPIPLPSRGWVGALEDGSARDTLTVNGAGRVTWNLVTGIGDNNRTRLLDEPIVEEMGYVDLPDIPDGAVVSMPELYGVSVTSWTGDGVDEYARAWSDRAGSDVGVTPLERGGTGATNAADARTNLGLGNVENKSSSTIRGELTKANVTSALGYTPPSSDKNTTYSLSQDSSDGHKLTLTGSDGTSKTVTVPDSDTKALGSMTGTLGVAHGGTGKTTAAEAWEALGGGSIGKKNSLAASDIPSLDTSKIGSGTFGVARGGTGVTSAQAERKRLGLGDTTGAVPVANGGTGATTAAAARTNLGVTAANVVGNQAITPSSVTATGEVKGSTVSDSVGSLADLRDSVSLDSTNLTRVQFNQKTNDRYGTIIFYGHNGGYGVIFDSSGITIWDMTQGKEIKHMNWTR